jgi:hypothetical protein
MGTRHAIDGKDWDRVKELAARYCDAEEGSDEQKELFNIELAREWLKRLDDHLLLMHDSGYAEDAKEFRRKLAELELK